MALTANHYRTGIFELIHAEKREVAVHEFYFHFEQKNIIQDDDLASTTLQGHETKEPRWKRNLRNTLQQLKIDCELVNCKKDFWRLPSPRIESNLDSSIAWELISSMAANAMRNNVVWSSTQRGKTYKVRRIDQNRITIYREQPHEEESLNRIEVIRAINCLNAAGGIVGRRTLNNIVAKEMALVFLHPMLDWFDESNYIGVIASDKTPTPNAVNERIVLNEIENDQTNIFDIIKRKRRKAQDRFKHNLIEIYGGKCCISFVDVESVLTGAHIEPHCKAGDNSSCNGLLLRVDIHKLFDDGLIAVDPNTFKVVIHESLNNTIYEDLNGNILLDRLDGKKPNDKFLMQRWNERQ